MKFIADTHTHTLMSGHAYSTLIENLTAAKEKGMRFLAVTDHTGNMPASPDDSYFICMSSGLPDEYNGVHILRGCEVNILDENGALDLRESLLSQLEWVIASIHSYITSPMGYDAHTRLWLNIAKNPHVDVIGHCGEEQFKFDYEEGVRAFAAYGKIVEINNASFRTRPTARENCMRIAELCVKHGVPLVVSSDAHFASNVGSFPLADEYLTQAGIPEESILNANLDRFTEKVRQMTGRSFT